MQSGMIKLDHTLSEHFGNSVTGRKKETFNLSFQQKNNYQQTQ